jgi:hypothetical protein
MGGHVSGLADGTVADGTVAVGAPRAKGCTETARLIQDECKVSCGALAVVAGIVFGCGPKICVRRNDSSSGSLSLFGVVRVCVCDEYDGKL